MLKEQNGRIIDEKTGRDVILHGVNRCGMECWSGNGDILRIVGHALDNWHADTLRLPVSQDRWFGYDGYNSAEEYREQVDSIVNFVAKRKKYLILDCHFSDCGVWGQHTGGRRMADQNSVVFWRDAAKRYANHPYVLFNLYNEPQDISWQVWRDGGWIEEDGVFYQAAGMQQLVDTVRSTGAKNLCILGGLVWASLTNGPAFGFDIHDPDGNGIVLDAHIYPWNGLDWDTDFRTVEPLHPVMIGEFGHQGTTSMMGPACMPREVHEIWMPKLVKWIEDHRLSYCAWCFDNMAGPCLLSDMQTFEPTASHGVYVKAMLDRAYQNGECADQILIGK